MIALHLWEEKYGWESRWTNFTTSKKKKVWKTAKSEICYKKVIILQWQSYKIHMSNVSSSCQILFMSWLLYIYDKKNMVEKVAESFLQLQKMVWKTSKSVRW